MKHSGSVFKMKQKFMSLPRATDKYLGRRKPQGDNSIGHRVKSCRLEIIESSRNLF